jgi:predicted RNA-binding protein YlxR (DUF448 family)/ribosomal protein L30E
MTPICKRKLRPYALILWGDLVILNSDQGAEMAEVIRQCIACRKRNSKKSLFRIVRTPKAKIEFDPEYRKPGRGAYLCAEKACLSLAQKQRLIGSCFRCSDPSSVYLELARHLERKGPMSVEVLIGFAAKGGKCVFGMTAVQQMLKRDKIHLLLVSENMSEKNRKKAAALAEHHRVPILSYAGNRPLDSVVGRLNCRVLGITDLRLASKISKTYKNPD